MSADNQSIPQEAALPILAALRTTLPMQAPPKSLAEHVAQVFQTLNTRPPGVLASIGLLGLHAGSFLAAVVLTIVLLFPWGGSWKKRQPTSTFREPPSFSADPRRRLCPARSR